MIRIALVIALFFVVTMVPADSRVEVAAQALAKSWAADGLEIKTGFEADGTQNLAVLARGGYLPLKLTAKAGVKSVLRVYTNKTADCSRGFTLPDLKMKALLPLKGVTAFTIPAMNKGQTLFGTCGMGMYSFEITFTE